MTSLLADLSVAAALALCVLFSPDAARGGDEDFRARYIVFEIDSTGVVRPQRHQVVRLSGPLSSRTDVEILGRVAEHSTDSDRVVVRLLSTAGNVIYQDVVETPHWLRSEFGADGTLSQADDSRPVSLPSRSFVVRVPVFSRTRLSFSFVPRADFGGGPSPSDTEFDLDALAADRSLPLANFSSSAELRALPSVGASGNRVDLLVMGDGYTSSQSAKFDADASSVTNSFLSIPPYSTYANFIKTSTLFTASSQSGADHPTYDPNCKVDFPPTCCADSQMRLDPLNGTFVDTAFDAAFCYSNIYRLLVVNSSKVLVAAAAQPDWDVILVIINDPTYGGSGGGLLAVVSTHSAAVQVAQHEYGHSFTRLTDEYTTPFPGFAACSDISGPACEPNVTDQASRPLIKWFPWIDSGAPIPTPSESAYSSIVGLFQGARFLSAGMYRPQLSCIMQSLGQPFCRICSQEYVLRLYRGGWGVPASGIDNIEPGSETPAPGPVSMTYSGSVTLTVQLLQPVGGPSLSVAWFVNGVVVPGASSSSYTFSPGAPGTYRVEIRTRDSTLLVNPAMAGTSLDHSRVWNITAKASRRPRRISFR